MQTEPSHPSHRTLILAAFGAVYVIWGSTYFAIRVAVETLPPFLMAGTRSFVAGIVLFAWLRFRGTPAPNRLEWRNAAVSGVLMLVCGSGLVAWAEQWVPSGLAALVIALTPVWFALIEWARPGGQRPTGQTTLGILIGFAGIALLVSGRSNGMGTAQPTSIPGLMAVLFSALAWAGGSMFSRHSAKPRSPWMNSAAQMVCGGAGCLLVAVLTQEPARAKWHEFSARSLWALVYLVVVGSWIAFSAYIYLLKMTTPARLSTYAYVNPVIALFLGWAFLGEVITARMLAAAVVILFGVIIITLPDSTLPTLFRAQARLGSGLRGLLGRRSGRD